MILAFDLGKSLGWAAGAPGELPQLGCEALPDDSVGASLLRFEGKVQGMCRRYEPRAIVWEKPFISEQRHAQAVLRARRLFGMWGSLERIAHGRGCKSACWTPQTLRKQVVGHGRATEDQIFDHVRSWGLNVTSDHAADAFLAWVCGAATFFKSEHMELRARCQPITL